MATPQIVYPRGFRALRQADLFQAAGAGLGTVQRLARIGALVFLMTTLAHAQDSQFSFDANGNLTARTAAISVLPQILGQPQNQVVSPGASASFSVVAANTGGLSYQWRLNGLDIIGAIGATLLLHDVSTNDEGQYTVVLTNPSGNVTSAPATLMIDTDADGLGDSWERAYFGSLAQYSTGDADGDGVSNLQESLDGTDPTNSASALFRLTLLTDGGQVTVAPNRFHFTNGETVTLTATAFAPHSFHGWGGDIEATNNPITLTITNDIRIFAYLSSYDIAWRASGVNGNWHDRPNWSPRLVPASNDNVFLPHTANMTNNTEAVCRRLTVGAPGNAPAVWGSGTLRVMERCNWMGGSMANVFMVMNQMNWTSGTLGGSGRTIIASGATLNISNSSAVTLSTHTLDNAGTILWTGTHISLNAAVITNRPGALFHAQNAAALTYIVTAGNRFDNAGTFRKSGNPGTTSVGGNLAFNNYGTVDVQSGTLLCNNDFLNNGAVNLVPGTTNRIAGNGSARGTFDTPAGALVEWSGGGTFALSPGAQLNGAGLYRISVSTLACNTAIDVANLDLAGTRGGTGVLTINNMMNWTSGSMNGPGRTVIAPGATLHLNNPSAVTLNTGSLENGGTILWTGSHVSLNASVVTNRPGALFHAQNAPAAITFILSGGNRFDNAGIFRKSANTGATTVGPNVAFNNYGTVEVETGMLFCNNDFRNNGVVNLAAGTTNRIGGAGSASGSFNNPASAIVEWSGGGTFTLNAGAQLNGAGLYRVNTSTLACNAPVSVTNLDLMGTVSGTGPLTVNNLINWTIGSMNGPGRTVIAPGATLNINTPSAVTMNTRTLENGGTILWTGSNISLNASVITNRPGALFHALNAAGIYFVSAVGRVDNAGTFRKTSSGTTIVGPNIAFNNYNIVEIRSGILAANGGYISRINSLLNCAIGGTSPGTNFGQLRVAGAVNLNGSLSVDLVNGFIPARDDSFTVLAAGTRSGTFANFIYPSNEVTMVLSNAPTAVIVRVTDVLIVPPPMLLQPERVGPDIKLTWTAVSNATYRLEFTPWLNSSNWSTLPGDVTAASNSASRLDVWTSSNRFYRVRSVP
jgi:hypothetical protein